MTRNRRRKFAIIALIQLAITVTSLLHYHKLTLLYYINISFYYSFVLLISALLLFIIHTGFFDIIAKSFTIAFSKHDEKRTFSELTPLSELVGLKRQPLVFHGLISSLLMIIALVIYYA